MLNFEGKLNDPASERIRLSTTASNGWNLIGNPLATAIKISDNTPETNESDNFLEVNHGNFDSNSYGIYYLSGSAGENGEYEVINKASGNTYAQMGQGFFVKKNNEALVISMSVTPAMQFHMPSENLKSNNLNYPEVKLTVSGSGKSASTKILFIDGTHQGLDIGYDARHFRANPDFCLYTRLVDDNGVDFQLQCLPTDQYNKYRIPIGLDSNTGGEIVISAENVNLESGCCVFLEDIATNSFTDLSKNNYRTTVASNTPGLNRFFLYTANVKGFEAQVTSGKLIAYATSNAEIRIIGRVHENAEATLFDTSGRTVLKRMLNGSILNILGLSNINSGLYLLTIKDIGTTQTIKVMVNK